ncbi:MAG TPA: hypothetical protein DCP91_09165 [Eggerthellaceae bacterium]|nr:hypothetical protein [Eggerthellaceae bacterium]
MADGQVKDQVDEAQERPRTRPLSVALAVLVVAAAVLALLAVASNIVRPKDNSPEAGIFDERAYGMLGEPRDSLDVLFLGDSETASAFSALQMWDEHGFASYVCSSNGQQLMYTNSLLHLALRDQSPKVVAFEANAFYAHFSVGDVLVRTASDLFPVFEYHDRWKHLTPQDFTGPVQATWTDDMKGFKLLGGGVAAEAEGYMAPTDEVDAPSALSRLFVHMMVDYCRQKGATPVFVGVPSADSWSMARHNGVAQLAEAEGVDFVDLSFGDAKVDIDWSTETFDRVHLSIDAASRVTHAYGDMLASAYDLPDHRGDPSYAAWDECLSRYEAAVSDLSSAAAES